MVAGGTEARSGLPEPLASVRGSNRHRSGERGFALVFVIWGLGLISLIALTVITAGRYRILAAANLVENAKAEALAEAGVNLRRLELRAAFSSGSPNTLPFATNGEPLLCTMPQGALAVLTVEDEAGKADLNTASPKLMSALLRGFGAGSQEADHVAMAIAEFSHPATNAVLDDVAFRAYAADGRAYGPKRGPFATVLELDQVIGMRLDLLRAVLPYVTVHSRSPGVDPRVAAPALLAALAGDEPARVAQLAGAARGHRAGEAAARGVPLQFLSPSTGRSFLVRAEVRTPAGGSFAREAIVELAAGEMDELREWRRGQGRFDKHFSAAVRSPDVAQRWPPC
jgi:general secretion pathway protein K